MSLVALRTKLLGDESWPWAPSTGIGLTNITLETLMRTRLQHLLYTQLPRHWQRTIQDLGIKTVIICWIYQRVLRINANVPWPVHRTSYVKSAHKIHRGTRYPGLSMGCYLDGRNGIYIGENVWIGPRVSIISMNHDQLDYRKYIVTSPIVIGDNCWLGTGCTILPGVQLGNHVIVAAGAVVTRSFEENDIILAGVPAKIIKRIDPYAGSIGTDARAAQELLSD